MKTLGDEISRFFKALDAELEHHVAIVVIGGAAALLRYRIEIPTADIDTWTPLTDPELRGAIERARVETGLSETDLPFQHSGIADAPYEFESRLERVLPELQRLRVYVPERHDLALMKALRCSTHDLDAIAAIHARAALELPVLVQRFREEMDAAIGAPERLRGNFLVMVERLFPAAVDNVRRALRPRATRES